MLHNLYTEPSYLSFHPFVLSMDALIPGDLMLFPFTWNNFPIMPNVDSFSPAKVPHKDLVHFSSCPHHHFLMHPEVVHIRLLRNCQKENHCYVTKSLWGSKQQRQAIIRKHPWAMSHHWLLLISYWFVQVFCHTERRVLYIKSIWKLQMVLKSIITAPEADYPVSVNVTTGVLNKRKKGTLK